MMWLFLAVLWTLPSTASTGEGEGVKEESGQEVNTEQTEFAEPATSPVPTVGELLQPNWQYTTLPDGLNSTSDAPSGYRDPRLVNRVLDRISVTGYMRFQGYHRTMPEPFVVIPTNQFANTPPYVFGVGDVYRDPPLLLMNVSARPTSKTYIGMDFALPNFFTGDLENPRAINLNLGMNLIGSFRTNVGRFAVQAGGINWTTLSPLTFGAPELFRFSMFERSPWDANNLSTDRIGVLHETGEIDLNNRFGQQAFKGFWFDGSDLPGNLAFRILYGKTPINGDLTRDIPNYTAGGYLRKYFGSNFIGYNTINYVNYVDSIAETRSGVSMHTVHAIWDIEGWKIHAEGGIGRLSLNSEGDWGEGFKVKLTTPKKVTFIPIDVEFFRFNQNFTNFFGAFQAFNATLATSDQTNPSGVAVGTAASFAGSINDVGQYANNQQGFSVNGRFKVGSFSGNVGLQASQELERVTNRLSFGHKINALPMSRFVTFSNGVGHYGRWNSFFRGVAENMTIIDVDSTGLPLTKNGFSTLQIQGTQRFRIKKRKVFVSYLGTFGSVQDHFSPVPEFSDTAYLRAHYHEADIYVEVTDWMSLVGSYGRERIRGNSRTNRGDNENGIAGDLINDPLNQTSRHLGLGADFLVSNEVGFYFRHRRFRQIGESFTLDNISGQETTVEIKIFF